MNTDFYQHQHEHGHRNGTPAHRQQHNHRRSNFHRQIRSELGYENAPVHDHDHAGDTGVTATQAPAYFRMPDYVCHRCVADDLGISEKDAMKTDTVMNAKGVQLCQAHIR